jgi:Phage tail repeat like
MPTISNILIQPGTGTKIVAAADILGSNANSATTAADQVAGHIHAIADVVNLQTELDSKSNIGHTHQVSDIVDFDVRVATKIASTLQLSGKADTIHTHKATDISGLSAVAISGDYANLINKPIFGSVSTFNVPISGDANTSQVVVGNDSRLTNARAALPHDHDIIIGDGISNRIMTKSSLALNFVAGSNITLGFDDTTKKITINSTGGSAVDRLTNARMFRFTGGITGSGSFDGSSDVTIATTITGIHSHTITDVVGLQATLDTKLSASYFSSFGDSMAKAIDQTAGRGLLGLGSIATRSDVEFAPSSHIGNGGSAHSTATSSNNGFLSSTDKSKLDGIAYNATVNASDVILKDRANHTGTQPISSVTGLQNAIDSKSDVVHSHSIATISSAGFISIIDKAKLDSIASNATANSSDTILKDRANHTGTQPASTITGLANIAVTGNYNDLSNLPTYGTASTKNVPTIGDANGSQVVMGNDSRLSDSRNPVSHNHVISIGDGTSSRISVSTAERLDIVPGANVSLVYDDALNKLTIATTGVIAGSVDTAIRLATARTIALTGGVTGSTTFDGSNNVNINAVVADNSHNHTMDNVSGLVAAMNGKANTVHSHSVVTSVADGFMSSADKSKLDGIAINATNNASDVSLRDRSTHTGVQPVSSITGLQTALDAKALLNHTHNIATTTTDGLLSAADKTKLDSISNGAGGGATTIAGISGLQAALDSKASLNVVTTTTNGLMIAADKVKLDGIATNATANSSDAILKDRANHTGLQAIATITNLQATLDAKALLAHNHTLSIGDGTTAKISVGTNERFDIAAGSNITLAFDDVLNKVTINSSATTNSVATADKWTTARTISLTGAITGSATIDGSANVSIATLGAVISKFFNQNTEPTPVIDGDRWYNDITGILLTRIGSVWAEL